VYLYKNVQIKVTSENLRSFSELDVMERIDSPPFIIKLNFLGISSSKLCSSTSFAFTTTGVSSTTTSSNNTNTSPTTVLSTVYDSTSNICTMSLFFKTGTILQGLASVKITHVTDEIDYYFQALKYEVATQVNGNFSCTENKLVSDTDPLDLICATQKTDSYVSDYIIPGPNELLRGKSEVTLNTFLTRVEMCKPDYSVKFGQFPLINSDCNICASSGKTLGIYDVKNSFTSADLFYKFNSGYSITFNFSKASTYRNSSIGNVLSAGGFLLAFILSAAGLKDMFEIVLGVLSYSFRAVGFTLLSACFKIIACVIFAARGRKVSFFPAKFFDHDFYETNIMFSSNTWVAITGFQKHKVEPSADEKELKEKEEHKSVSSTDKKDNDTKKDLHKEQDTKTVKPVLEYNRTPHE